MCCYENDVAIDLIGRYYSVLNESNCQSSSSSSQWKIFMDTTLMLMGFPETPRKSMIEVTNLSHLCIYFFVLSLVIGLFIIHFLLFYPFTQFLFHLFKLSFIFHSFLCFVIRIPLTFSRCILMILVVMVVVN